MCNCCYFFLKMVNCFGKQITCGPIARIVYRIAGFMIWGTAFGFTWLLLTIEDHTSYNIFVMMFFVFTYIFIMGCLLMFGEGLMRMAYIVSPFDNEINGVYMNKNEFESEEKLL